MFHYTKGWRYGCADWDSIMQKQIDCFKYSAYPVAGTMVRCKQIDRFNCAA